MTQMKYLGKNASYFALLAGACITMASMGCAQSSDSAAPSGEAAPAGAPEEEAMAPEEVTPEAGSAVAE